MGHAEARTYNRGDCVSFRKTDEMFGGLSNMAPGFPLQVNGVRIRTAEALYQACRFPHLPKVQRLIIDEGSPMTAKMKSKPYRKDSRPDWDAVRVRVMRWCLRVKLAQNWEKFGKLLLATGDRAIVEDSRKDDFWGAKPADDDRLIGENVLGRLLMELREQLRGSDSESLKTVSQPPIQKFLLYAEPIGVVEPSAGPARAERDLFPLQRHGDGERRNAVVSPPPPLPIEVAAAAAAERQPGRQIGIPTSAQSDRDAAPKERTEVSEYPKRLIEVDLPIKRISAHARHEKSIKHGHISTLHIWWARRPLAACRAIVLAALWPDPADPRCPERFRREAAARMKALRDRRGGPPRDWENPVEIRSALLDFIADFANWDLSNEKDYVETSRVLVQVAHESLGGAPGTRPLLVDPFAGGGAIPLEALRVGADVFSSDLNPVAVLINKVALEYIPKYGQRLADEVRRWGTWVKKEAGKELADFYPKDADGATPVAYIWARTIRCEGPSCGADIPLVRSLWLAKKGSRPVALRLVADRKNKVIEFQIVEAATPKDVGDGTMRKGSATCPLCQYTTPNPRVRAQLSERHGGSADARLVAVVTTRSGQQGRIFRNPTKDDLAATRRGVDELKQRRAKHSGLLSLVPDEPIPTERPSPNARGLSAVTRIGIRTFGDLFTPRQALALSVFVRLVRDASTQIAKAESDPGLAGAIQAGLACVFGKFIDRFNALARWEPNVQCSQQLFGRQAISIVWDFTELSPVADGAGSWSSLLDVWLDGIPIIANAQMHREGAVTVRCANATEHPLPNDAGDAFITDPPYYDAIPYADLSDFFYVWLRRVLAQPEDDLWRSALTPKDEEAIWNPSRIYSKTGKPKDEAFYEAQMAKALAEGRRVVSPGGVGVVVFAHKSTAGWEAILSALINAGWIATASWPIDTEMGSRVNAMGTASLASSVHIVCRPRENSDGSVRVDAVGDWRDVLVELPKRIHEWMPRLAAEGVVGADAIFACLGPALEVFSRYSRVEKASGEAVALKEYLEHVWAAVAKEALAMIFTGADTTGFEEDARLTAMWLWTLSAGGANGSAAQEGKDDEAGADEEDATASKSKVSGFMLEYDAARKIAQGLGAHLEALSSLVEVKGSSARLLPVAERTRSLFQKGETAVSTGRGKSKKRPGQLTMGFVADLEEAEEIGGWGDTGAPHKGETVLDRVHQSMILFGAGRGDALKRFLVDDGVGRDDRFWRLAQAFSALYPASTDEKRWVDGVLARKKGLGF